MGQFAKLLRWAFGAHAVLLALAIPSLFTTASKVQAASGHGRHRPAILAIFLFLAMLGSTSCALAWWNLRSQKPSARAWALTASIFSLLLPGLGTLVGICGLVVFSRRSAVAAAGVPQASAPDPLPGDGTSKYSLPAVQIGQLIWFIAASRWWTNWGHRQGLHAAASIIVWLLLVEAAIWVNVVLHEAGHVLAGWASQMKLRTFIIGPLRFTIRSGRWTCQFEPAGLLGGGAAGMVPTHLKNLRSRRAFMIVAGPAASLVTGAVATVAALGAPGHSWAPAWEFFAVVATLGWGYAIINAIPVRPDTEYSDGAQLYQLVSRGPWADFHLAFSMVSSSLVTPLRPRDFDISTIERAAAFLTHGERGMLLRLYAYMHYLDRGEVAEALRYFDAAQAIYPQNAKNLDADCAPDFVFVHAVLKHDLEGARQWWQRLEATGDRRRNIDYWRARAALLCIEGNIEEGRGAFEQGQGVAARLPACGAYDYDRDMLARVGQSLDATAVPPALPDADPIPATLTPVS